MSTPAWRYEKLTWPQMNDAIAAAKVPFIPVGSIEQHGPHLPPDAGKSLAILV